MLTGTIHQRSSRESEVVPMASPTMPGGIIGTSPKWASCSSRKPGSVDTRHAPQPAVK